MKFSMDTEQTVRTVTTKTLKLTGDDIRQLLLDATKEPFLTNPKAMVLVTFQIPGGGDWSGETIDVDKDHPVTVTITVEETRST